MHNQTLITWQYVQEVLGTAFYLCHWPVFISIWHVGRSNSCMVESPIDDASCVDTHWGC